MPQGQNVECTNQLHATFKSSTPHANFDSNDNKDIYNAQIRRGSKCAVNDAVCYSLICVTIMLFKSPSSSVLSKTPKHLRKMKTVGGNYRIRPEGSESRTKARAGVEFFEEGAC